MNKEKLIAAMREAIMSSIWIDHVGDIAGVDSAAGMCAEAALTLMSRELQAKDTTIKELQAKNEKLTGLLLRVYREAYGVEKLNDFKQQHGI